MFFIPGNMESLFRRDASIVVEFYHKSHALSDGGWLLANPIGYCSQMLNQELASALQQGNAKLGLRINGLPIQEVDRYRTAMRKLAVDLLHLKQENSRLETKLQKYKAIQDTCKKQEQLTEMAVVKTRAADCGLRAADCGLRAAGCGLRAAGCGLRAADCGLRAADCGLRTADCGLRTTI
ncbi:hypothetical protein QZH41_005851 [Actinostola sp. cb2023]|nr:hypothetical protein QZH41_005851 [Actinostola sp. cb2023]